MPSQLIGDDIPGPVFVQRWVYPVYNIKSRSVYLIYW